MKIGLYLFICFPIFRFAPKPGFIFASVAENRVFVSASIQYEG